MGFAFLRDGGLAGEGHFGFCLGLEKTRECMRNGTLVRWMDG
jgi:hypothetical protein